MDTTRQLVNTGVNGDQ